MNVEVLRETGERTTAKSGETSVTQNKVQWDRYDDVIRPEITKEQALEIIGDEPSIVVAGYPAGGWMLWRQVSS